MIGTGTGHPPQQQPDQPISFEDFLDRVAAFEDSLTDLETQDIARSIAATGEFPQWFRDRFTKMLGIELT